MTVSAVDIVTLSRIALIPGLYTTAAVGKDEVFVALFIVAAGTDVADGWLARRLGRTDGWGRRFDSLADALFYYSIPVWFWSRRPEIVRQWFPWVLVPLPLFLAGVAFKIFRRRIIAALHLPTTRAAGAATVVYLLWALLGMPPVLATRLLTVVLAAAALVELVVVLE
ncbi:MAG: CDP-alcohol phosphatidyltransferase family protein [Armatimonadota bacterium]|nr:CDP-alcohol phosphatidyltransferase family protein [Armatimonadota bacterium]MDR7468489.1 CDP-alcohol phosphatidyltransferase family protein [Armatimonadota bacterium]MDR7559622.1 CDP-alcohol phosphatidyltransferase family protein [Armatimonadota bacterium]